MSDMFDMILGKYSDNNQDDHPKLTDFVTYPVDILRIDIETAVIGLSLGKPEMGYCNPLLFALKRCGYNIREVTIYSAFDGEDYYHLPPTATAAMQEWRDYLYDEEKEVGPKTGVVMPDKMLNMIGYF